MNVKEALSILKTFDKETLLGQPESDFGYSGKIVPHYEWEDDEKIVFTIAYIPKDYNGEITKKVAEKYFAETWIVRKADGWAEPWYE